MTRDSGEDFGDSGEDFGDPGQDFGTRGRTLVTRGSGQAPGHYQSATVCMVPTPSCRMYTFRAHTIQLNVLRLSLLDNFY